jgi:hypothetical protein
MPASARSRSTSGSRARQGSQDVSLASTNAHL